MDTTLSTDKQGLINERLSAHGVTLVRLLEEQRSAGISYDDIAFNIRTLTSIKLTPATVMHWCRELIAA